MSPSFRRWLPGLFLASAVLLHAGGIRVERLPMGGRQPATATAPDGSQQVVFLTGEPKASDVQFQRREVGHPRFSEAVRVSEPNGLAIALGTIRGPQIAVGGDGVIHVAWNGGANARETNGSTPLFHTRSTDGGRHFEPARNRMGDTRMLDGGAAVAADRDGTVAVVWHGFPATGPAEERVRGVFAAVSTNAGSAFTAPIRLDGNPMGACGCCALAAAFRPTGELRVAFRSAATPMDRDLRLLEGRLEAAPWNSTLLEAWRIGLCPMSSLRVQPQADGGWMAWEAGDRVTFADAGGTVRFRSPKGVTARHPRVARNPAGDVLCVWTEDTGWARGGRIRWHRLDAHGLGMEDGGRDDLAEWNFAAAVPDPDGFTVLY